MRFKYLVLLLLQVFVRFLDTSQAEQNKCISPDWIAYKDEKCFKILDTSLPFIAAVEACRKLFPFEEFTGCKHHSTLLKISSSEEQEFIESHSRLSPRSQNVWIGHNDLSKNAYTNWVAEVSNSSTSKDAQSCVDIELDDYINRGKWRRVSCIEKRRVVCQNFQKLPITDDIQLELIITKRELQAQKIEIQELKSLINQLLISHHKIAEADKTILSTNSLIEQLNGNCIPTEPIDLKPEKTAQLEYEVNQIKNKIKSLESKILEFQEPLGKVNAEVVELRRLVADVKISLNRTQAETDWLKNLSETIKGTMTDLNNGLETLKNLFKGSAAPIEQIRGDVQMVGLRLTSLETSVTTAKADIELIRGKVNEVQGNLISQFGKLQIELNSFKSTAVMSVRLTNLQGVNLYRGPGYNDQHAWVITAVSNFNWDNYPDGVSRRQMQILVNNVWRNI